MIFTSIIVQGLILVLRRADNIFPLSLIQYYRFYINIYHVCYILYVSERNVVCGWYRLHTTATLSLFTQSLYEQSSYTCIHVYTYNSNVAHGIHAEQHRMTMLADDWRCYLFISIAYCLYIHYQYIYFIDHVIWLLLQITMKYYFIMTTK